jgi:SAM-dependent methyltransferase
VTEGPGLDGPSPKRFAPRLPGVLDRAHAAIAAVVKEGDATIDATVGNGHDTAFLARQVGPEGAVFGFDTQPQALRAARHRLQEAGVDDQVRLVQAGHETMADRLPQTWEGRVAAVTFNLGYLPGGDPSITTQPETTVAALRQAAAWLRPGGRISIVCYTGHDGGRQETEEVERWTAGLDQTQFRVLAYRFLNQRNNPPRLLVVEKIR